MLRHFAQTLNTKVNDVLAAEQSGPEIEPWKMEKWMKCLQTKDMDRFLTLVTLARSRDQGAFESTPL